MGGVNINEDIVIDKSIHKSINSRSAVLKVKFILLLLFLFIYGYYDCDLFIEKSMFYLCAYCIIGISLCYFL